MTESRADRRSNSEARSGAERVYQELLDRVGEAAPRPRLEPTRRLLNLLGDPQDSFPFIHVTGTNGKTSTSRIAESILRAHGLRTGLLTSPHLVRMNERIVIDGEPISDETLVRNWEDIRLYLGMVDAELTAAGEEPITYFEALTALAFASFADAPVDAAVIEVGMGGEWDSTNVGNGQVAVFTPIALDHMHRLGNTIAKIATTKAGIIKPGARVVSSKQTEEAMAAIGQATAMNDATLAVEGDDFELLSSTVAVGGQLISVRGLAAEYSDLFLPLFGDHQAINATVAIAAVESFLGGGTQPIDAKVLAEGIASAASPGRLQILGTQPTVIIDAAHNPHGATALAASLRKYFDFSELALVMGILADKDAHGIVDALVPLADRVNITQSHSDRAIPSEELGDRVEEWAQGAELLEFPTLDDALSDARAWAADAPGRAVLVTGSITLIGEAIELATEQGWKL